jgi:hypothetical protein
MEDTARIACPYCGGTSTIEIDPSLETQQFIEDCTVCCQPIQIRLECEDGNVLVAEASRP